MFIVCVLHIQPFFLPVDMQHTLCPYRFFILERYKLCGNKTMTQGCFLYNNIHYYCHVCLPSDNVLYMMIVHVPLWHESNPPSTVDVKPIITNTTAVAVSQGFLAARTQRKHHQNATDYRKQLPRNISPVYWYRRSGGTHGGEILPPVSRAHTTVGVFGVGGSIPIYH